MENWSQSIQQTIDIIDRCIRQQEDEALTLRALSAALGYSESYVSRKFRALSGMPCAIICASGIWRLPFGMSATRRIPCWKSPCATAFPRTRRSPVHSAPLTA